MAYEYQNFATLGVNLNRQKYGALDISQVFNSQADLNYYISKGASTEGVSEYWYKSDTDKVVPYPYAGQYVALVNNSSRVVTAYILQEKDDGTFECKEVGKLPTGDDKSIVVDDAGKISIKGIDELASDKVYQLTYTNGVLSWVIPDNTTVEGLSSSMAALKDSVGELSTKVDGHTTTIGEHTTAIQANASDIDTLEGDVTTIKGRLDGLDGDVERIDGELANRYTKAETYTKAEVNAEIGKQAHFNAKVVESVDEVTDSTTLYLIKDDTATGNDHYKEYLLIDGVATLIGDTSTNLDNYVQTPTLDDYAKKSELADTNSKVTNLTTKVDNDIADLSSFKSTVSTTYETKADATSKQAEINEALAEKASDSALQALTTRVTTAEGEIDDLQAADTSLGSRIKALEDVGSEKNVINSVDETEFTITDRKLSVEKVAISKVDGLDSALAAKVDEGSLGTEIEKIRDNTAGLLSATNESKLAKLDGIAAGAQVNKIESVKVHNVALAIAADKSVNIDLASAEAPGVVQSSTETNGVAVDGSTGKMTVNSLHQSKIVQDTGDVLILDCGHAE